MARLESKLEMDGSVPTLHLGGTLDVNTAPDLTQTADQIVAGKPQHVVVDLAGLELIDSSGVAALVGLYKRIRAEGGEMKVIHARDQPQAIFKLLRMDKVFL